MHYSDPMMLTGYVGEDKDVAQLVATARRIHGGWHRDEAALTGRSRRGGRSEGLISVGHVDDDGDLYDDERGELVSKHQAKKAAKGDWRALHQAENESDRTQRAVRQATRSGDRAVKKIADSERRTLRIETRQSEVEFQQAIRGAKRSADAANAAMAEGMVHVGFLGIGKHHGFLGLGKKKDEESGFLGIGKHRGFLGLGKKKDESSGLTLVGRIR